MSRMVREIGTLKAMEKQGLIELHEHTGKKVTWYYGDVTAWYVQDGQRSFEFRGKKYESKYVDGCFYPFIFEEAA